MPALNAMIGASVLELRAVNPAPAARINVEGGGAGLDECSPLRIKDRLSVTCNSLIDDVQELEIQVQRGYLVGSSLFYRFFKRCIAQKDLVLGRRVHALVVKNGSDANAFLANHIIRMYASHGRLQEATEVFFKVLAPDTFIWRSLISAYADHGEPGHAICMYRQMRQSTLKPNNYVFAAVLKACALAVDLGSGKEIHADIVGSDVKPDIFVGSCLVDMYSKCGSLADARKVFDTWPLRNVVMWTAMIAGYAQQGLGQEALNLYSSMQQEGIIPANQVTFVCLLQACASVGALHQGKQLHFQIQQRGLENDVVVGNCLVNMYAKCGSLQDARRVFDRLLRRDVVTWNVMFAGYAQHGLGQEALALFTSMEHEGVTPPDHVTFVCLLQACASAGAGALYQGKKLHAILHESGLDTDLVIGNCMVNMYTKCGSLEDARRVFDRFPRKNVVTWTTMIAGYAEHGLGQEALALYGSMQQDGITSADHVMFVCLLQACTSIGSLHQGQQLHKQIQQQGLDSDLTVGNCLVHMYSKCGSLADARRVFDALPTRDVVTWTALITGYVQQGLGEEALALYGSMEQNDVIPADHVTLRCLLQACACAGALHQGKQVHAQIEQMGLDADISICNCLIDMYAKCGRLTDARRVFDRLPRRDVVSWTSLLNGYAEHSDAQSAVQCFEEMLQQGVKPDGATFVCLLVACSHAGLVKEGQQYFKMMVEDNSITPTVQHYNCMVDLLGRAGHLVEAEDTLQKMPFEDDVVGWTSLLSACKSHGDVERGRRCFDHLLKLEPENATAYVLLASMYANACNPREVDRIESLRKYAGAKKKPAKASIEVSNRVHVFRVGEERGDISSKLDSVNMRLKVEGGHVPHTDLVLKAVSQNEKEDALCGHAEKLALAYGLLNTPDGTPLLVTKNLRMCNDCHSSTKIMSRLEKRPIIVRDSHRFHSFVDGVCSCGDRY